MTITAVEPRIDRRAFLHGVRATMSLAIGFMPFALALGAAFASADLDPWVTWSSSWIIFAGAAQAAAVSMLDSGDAPVVVVASCLIINSRLLLYGASLRPHMEGWSAASRGALAYFMTDAVYAAVGVP
jgi:predicted branched-subunit amino acid permease